MATSGDSVLVNMTGISTSQSIPIRFGGVLDTSIELFFNSSMDSVTIGVNLLVNFLLLDSHLELEA